MEQLVARRAHNPKVVGSSPAPATILEESLKRKAEGFFRLVARRAHTRWPVGVGSSPAPATILEESLKRKAEGFFCLVARWAHTRWPAGVGSSPAPATKLFRSLKSKDLRLFSVKRGRLTGRV
jgi:hypothetical protein